MNYRGDPYWTTAKFDSKYAKKGERIFYFPKTKTVLKGMAAEKAAVDFERLQDEYEAYLIGADDGNGRDVCTKELLMTFNEWLNN